MFLAGVQLSGCGGGGGGGGGTQGPPSQATTFVGNLREPSGLLRANDGTTAGVSVVQVCVVGTSFCTEVDETGAFTLDAAVGGDVVLQFEGPGFTARLPLQGVPRGATVRITDIECSTQTGQCHAEDVEILAPDNEPPDCSMAAASPAMLWPPNHALVRIAIRGVVDPDGDQVTIEATNVVQDEAIDAPGSGNTAPDSQLAPLAVRAERSGQGNGRVYAVAFVADDGRGGTCTGTVQVCVPHDRGQGATCVDDGAQFDSF
jgi:hypothetical protein